MAWPTVLYFVLIFFFFLLDNRIYILFDSQVQIIFIKICNKTLNSSKILSVSSCSCSFFSWRRTQHPIFSSHTEPLSLNSSQRLLLVDLSFHVTVQNLRRWIIVFLQLGCIKSFEFCLHLMGVIFISISWFTSVILSGRHLSPPIHDCKLQTQS